MFILEIRELPETGHPRRLGEVAGLLFTGRLCCDPPKLPFDGIGKESLQSDAATGCQGLGTPEGGVR